MGKRNVIIDARMVDEHLHGIARYTYEIIKEISFTDKVHMMLLINNLEVSKNIFGRFPNIEFIKMKSKFLSLTEQIELPYIINKYKGKAIFHSPSFVSSPFIKAKMIMTIHDLNHLRFPEYYTPFHKYYYKYVVKPSALKCEKILTVSEFSKNEIVNWLNCDRDKVVVTYNGVSDQFRVIDDKDLLLKVKKKYNLPDKFVLYIGNLKPHKNVETLVKSMSLIKNNDVKLVINGKVNQSLNNLINSYDLKDRVYFIGYVDDDDLPAIYNLADVFVFPSLYEGFGLPPLEAMACKKPVVAFKSGGISDVVQNNYNGLLFDFGDISGFCTGIIKIENNTKLKKMLVNNGYESVNKRFNVKRVAVEHEKLYLSLL